MDHRLVLWPAVLVAGMDYAENATYLAALQTGELPWLKTPFSAGKFFFLTTAVFLFPGGELLTAVVQLLRVWVWRGRDDDGSGQLAS